ncbi:MAG: tail fiber domain-containing protein, partial [Saprospiraceae bacterium]
QDNTDDWRLFIGGASDLVLAYNNVTVGTFNPGTGNYVASSDERLKKDIQPLSDILQKVLQLQPKSYQFIADANQTKSLGFIAQEVEPLFPEIVNEREDGIKGLAYDEFSVIAIQAIKEQQAMITQQQTLIDQLLQRVQALEQK